jgi:hypothetical protein
MELRVPSTSVTAEYALEACRTAMTNGEWENARTWLAVWEGMHECSMEHSINISRSTLAETMLTAMETNRISMVEKLPPSRRRTKRHGGS